MEGVRVIWLAILAQCGLHTLCLAVSPVDVLLLLDSTDRFDSAHFSKQQQFGMDLVDVTMSTNPVARFGLYTFGENTQEEFHLNSFTKAEDMKRLIQYMWFSTGHEDLLTAITETVQKGFQSSAGDRDAAPNFLVVVTFTPVEDQSKLSDVTELLSTMNVKLIILNLAGDSSLDAMVTLAGDGLINLPNPEALSTAVNKVNEIINMAVSGSVSLTTSSTPTTQTPTTQTPTIQSPATQTPTTQTPTTQTPTTQAPTTPAPTTTKTTTTSTTQTTTPSPSTTQEQGPELTEWGDWTQCSRSCGEGFKFRTRECLTVGECEDAVLSESMDCSIANCTTPVHGKWTFWGSWSECSKSCEKGIQHRTRQCAQPAPQHGGKQCVGSTRQEKDCADFPCPDCGRPCPSGSHLSDSCDVCICSDMTFFGKVLSDTNKPIQMTKIFLTSSKYKPLTQTDSFGSFRVESVCLMDEDVYIEAGGHVPIQMTPILLNDTHWTLPTFKLETYVQPVFKVSPEDKVRIAGQSLSLCCEAIGKPLPTAYKWLKDGIELEDQGTDGTLVISSTTTQDTGSYTCIAVTDAGTSQSEEADVQIYDSDSTCGPPSEKIEKLPDSCYIQEGETQTSTVNVGTCGNTLCITRNLHDNGSCSDYWPNHCCSATDFQMINVNCDGFSYKIQQVTACTCKPCAFKTVITGRAFGRSNGTEVPLEFGQVIVNGDVIATTSQTGVFKFELKNKLKRIVATFHDEYFTRLADITKVITVSSGSSSFTTVVMPLRPTPVPFETNNGTEIHMGGDGDSMPPAAKLSIPPDSVVTADGEPFTGNVKASLHFMDPRKREDIEAANGDFVSESPDGARMPLKTFGMFQLGLQDDDGNQLSTNKPLKFSMDSSMFDVPLDEHGNPDVALWSYDENKGIWIEIAKLQKEEDTEITDGRRKLLQSAPSKYTVDFHPGNVPVLDLYNTQQVRQWTGKYTNCDHSTKIYEYVEVKSPKGGACYVAVSIYKDLTLLEPYTDQDIEITTYVREIDGQNYIGATTTKLLYNGRACIPIFCDKRVYISVTRNGAEKLYAGEHYLPFRGYVKNTTDNEVLFESRDLGNALSPSYPGLKPGTILEGPVFQLEKQLRCARQLTARDNSFQFKFAPLTKAPVPPAYDGPTNQKNSWYPVAATTNTFRTCFMKMAIKIAGNYDLRVIATSKLDATTEYGTYNVGPTPDPRNTDLTVRAACFEFRCQGLVHDGGTTRRDLPTIVDVQLATSNKGLNCAISETKVGLNITSKTTSGRTTGFTFIAESGSNYGERYGVFITNNPASETRDVCESGDTYNPGSMSPLNNYAVLLDCL